MDKKINWNEAPKWANAVVESNNGNAGHLYYVTAFGGFSPRQKVGYQSIDADALADMRENSSWRLVDTRPVQWGGQGLPPAGLEVEWKQGSNHEWVRAKVIAYFKDEAWLSVNGDRPFTIGNPGGFRPIRTPEQIAMEERKRAVEAMAEELKHLSGPKCLGVLYGLYDLGYRKQVAP